MNWLFFSCQHVTELVEKKQFVPLSLMERIKFKGHILICNACRSYERQSALLEDMFYQMTDSSVPEKQMHVMDNKTKVKILKKLEGES